MARRRKVGSRYLVWLDEREADRASIGGKGYSLSRLAAIDAPVPIACALTTDAWRLSTRALGLDRRAAPLTTEALLYIRTLVSTSPLPSPIARSIAVAFQEFESMPDGHISLAVRSSATSEDSGAYSFAGIHDTVLGVRSHVGLEAAVRLCWASIWTDRAVEYRSAAGLEVEECAISVVIQQMMRPDVSFVLFTRDPVSGDRDQAAHHGELGAG